MDNFPFRYPSSRQAYFAALCGVGTATIVFAITPPLFAGLFRLLCLLFGSTVRDSIFAGTAIGVSTFIFKFVGPIALFLYLDKKQPTRPECFFINLFSQFLLLYLLRIPLMRINGISGGLLEFHYIFLALVWPIVTVLTQWGASQYIRKKMIDLDFSLYRKIQSLIKRKRPLTTGAKVRRFLCVCLLLLGLAWVALYRVYYPRVFYDYLKALPHPGTCRVEVTYFYNEIKWELDESQRAGLFERMKIMTYRSAYGPLSLSERAPSDVGYIIYIYPSNGEVLPPFVLQPDVYFYSGFFCESPIFPVGYWLNMENWYDLHNWLQDLPVD